MNTEKSPKSPTILKKTLLSLATIVVTLILVEIVLQVIGYEYSPLKINMMAAANDARDELAFGDSNFQFDSNLLWRPRPGESVFNAQGFRGQELSTDKPEGEIRVLAVGDSNTLGWKVYENEPERSGANWPTMVEKQAEEEGQPIVVANAGVWGYSAWQGKQRLEEMMIYQPDVVLISFGANDACPVVVSDADYAATTLKAPWRYIKLAHLTRAALDKITLGTGMKQEDLVARVSLDEYRQLLRDMIDRARKAGAKPILLTRPYIGRTQDHAIWKYYGDDYRQATIDVGRETETPVADIYEQFKDKVDLFADESHFTREGHQQAAAIILQEIEKLIGLPPAKAKTTSEEDQPAEQETQQSPSEPNPTPESQKEGKPTTADKSSS